MTWLDDTHLPVAAGSLKSNRKISYIVLQHKIPMYRFFHSAVDSKKLRQRVRNMTDEELLRFGCDALFMCSDSEQVNGVQPPREVFLVQLREVREERKRRRRAKRIAMT